MQDLTKKIAVVLNVRQESNRIENKMLKDFAGSSLFEICLDKLMRSKVFQHNDIVLSYNDNWVECEKSIERIENIYNIPLGFTEVHRTKESTMEEEDQKKIYEFYKHIPKEYDYCILVNPCCPLLSIETIDAFYSTFKYSDKDGLFGVIKKKNYIWGKNKEPINLPDMREIMNTKNSNCTIYEAAHCLYGSKLSFIPEKRFMGEFTSLGPELFTVPENESFDIDYPWQFEYGEILYKGLNNE